METRKRIPADRLIFATISVLRTLVLNLSEKGLIDLDEFVETVQETAVAHREAGDPNNLADAIQAISRHLSKSGRRFAAE